MTARGRHRGLTMIEAVVSLVIISVLGVAALRAFSAATVSRAMAQDRARGVALAGELLGEITALPYGDPTTPAAEQPNRSTFTTVGHYDGWSASPPIARNGTILAPAVWRREATVMQVELDGVTETAAATGMVRIIVRVFKGDRLVATQEALRSSAWDTVSGGAP